MREEIDASAHCHRPAIADFEWKDRGQVCHGYTAGVACCYALALKGLDEGDPIIADLAQPTDRPRTR